MPDEVKLLPCPFCGKQPVQQDAYLALIGGREPGWYCPGHVMEMPADQWNTRTIEATRPTDEVVERARNQDGEISHE